jgi:uncharacterized protein YndB with AHSA1/START domain
MNPNPNPSPTDRIERTNVIKAPRSRVWKALTDAAEFGTWFGAKMEGRFAAGTRIRGRISNPGFEHLVMDLDVVDLKPERLFSWRWHPNAIDPKRDYSEEPTTLVTFTLDEVPGGTKLTVVESGFDGIPAARRAEAFANNGKGWSIQVERIAKHVG